MFAINRRKLLTSSFGAVLLSFLPAKMTLVLMGEQRTALRVEVEETLRGIFRDLEAAKEVGRRVLEVHPKEADPEPLIAALGRESDPTRLGAALLRRRRDELGKGQSLIVDGWVLARCEAQLCAFVASDVASDVAFDVASEEGARS